MRKKLTMAAGAVVLVAAITGAAAHEAAVDDGDVTVTGPAADAASRAALTATGGGRVNAVERDSEDGATWEVEVTKTDGATVDVRLDDTYAVVIIEGDSESG
jgi:hypothetical protein